MPVVEIPYRACGGAKDLFLSTYPEVVIEGPAGTGKTRAVWEYVDYMCGQFPGIRVLAFRKTRVSMTESVLVTFEEKVCWDGHPALSKGNASRATRRSYEYPNGSTIVLGGMDKSSRIMSTEYDIAVCFEATEITLAEWEAVMSRLRNNMIPAEEVGVPEDPRRRFFTQGILDCNPEAEGHWINQRPNLICTDPDDTRFEQPMAQRILSRHVDNPAVTPEYLGRLRNLTGVRRARLYEGKWVSAEGQIWDNFDSAVHMIDAEDVPWLKWHYATVDWGYRNPGVLQVWGVDRDNRAYRVAEVYRTNRHDDWWAEVAVELWREFGIRRFVCDPAEPDRIDKFNDRLGVAMGRDAPRLAIGARNDLQTGLAQVRWALDKDKDGKPRMLFVRDALRYGRDPVLAEQFRPTCTEEEIPSYVFEKTADGRPIREKPDPTCADHGCDTTRYAAMYHWRRDLSREEEQQVCPPGSIGHILGDDKILRRWSR